MNTNKIDNYELVFQHDQAEFLKLNINTIMMRTKTALSPDKSALMVPVLDKTYLVLLCDGTIRDASAPQALISVSTRLLIMHYLIYSKDTAYITGDEIPFHSIRGVGHFEAAFIRETIPPLKKAFEGKLSAFLKAGELLGGTICTYGDASVRLQIFPLISVTYILWEGDEEFPMNVNVLFDKGITACTHPEDVPVLGSYGASQLIAVSRI